jgi:CRISPR system Cascade subunit CasE
VSFHAPYSIFQRAFRQVRVALCYTEARMRKRLNDSYAWHRAAWEAFPERPNDNRKFLTRIDDRGRFYELMLLSEEKPTLPGWGQWETKQIKPSFLEHDRYAFNLRANTTVKRVVRDESGDRKKNGRRTAIYKPGDLRDWLERKAQQAGFTVEQFAADPPIARPFRKKGKSGKHVRVDFRGILKVTDSSAFKEAFSKGIGPAKAFGFGMLLLESIEG